MKLDKTFKTLVVLGLDCFRPYYNTIVNPAHDTSRFHIASPPAVVVTPVSIRRFLLPMQVRSMVSFGNKNRAFFIARQWGISSGRGYMGGNFGLRNTELYRMGLYYGKIKL